MCLVVLFIFFFFFQAEDGIRDLYVTGVQTCALPIWSPYDSTGAIDDSRGGRKIDPLARSSYEGTNGTAPRPRAPRARRRRRSRHPPNARALPHQRRLQRADGFQRAGGARPAAAAEARLHPPRSDDARDGRMAIRP